MPRPPSLLRYYWFRMADILVPLGVALEVIRGLALLESICGPGGTVGPARGDAAWPRSTWGGRRRAAAANLRPQADNRITNLAAWREICDWAAANTPPDAVFLTPRDTQSFHWYAGRSEVVGYKDIPQDAVGIVEWWRRVGDIYRQPQPGTESDGFASLAELGTNAIGSAGPEISRRLRHRRVTIRRWRSSASVRRIARTWFIACMVRRGPPACRGLMARPARR